MQVMQKMCDPYLGWEDPLEEEMAIQNTFGGKSHGQRSLTVIVCGVTNSGT